MNSGKQLFDTGENAKEVFDEGTLENQITWIEANWSNDKFLPDAYYEKILQRIVAQETRDGDRKRKAMRRLGDCYSYNGRNEVAKEFWLNAILKRKVEVIDEFTVQFLKRYIIDRLKSKEEPETFYWLEGTSKLLGYASHPHIYGKIVLVKEEEGWDYLSRQEFKGGNSKLHFTNLMTGRIFLTMSSSMECRYDSIFLPNVEDIRRSFLPLRSNEIVSNSFNHGKNSKDSDNLNRFFLWTEKLFVKLPIREIIYSTPVEGSLEEILVEYSKEDGFKIKLTSYKRNGRSYFYSVYNGTISLSDLTCNFNLIDTYSDYESA